MAVTESPSTMNAVEQLVDYALRRHLLDPGQKETAGQQLYELCGVNRTSIAALPETASSDDPDILTEQLAQLARANGALAEGRAAYEQFAAGAMALLMPAPDQVRNRFSTLYDAEGPEAACAYLYNISCDSAYVHKSACARDIKWTTPSTWGDIEITINRSKPEKDPRDIAKLASAPAPASAAEPAANPIGSEPAAATDAAAAAARVAASASASAIPQCQLCLENESYPGRLPGDPLGPHPARQNLRIAHIPLAGTTWGLQYSPYAYYEEHCIVINQQHVPMRINRQTFANLLEFVDEFPQYFIGSNADLPIVGGSILNHDHYQAGLHTFPMDLAPASTTFVLPAFDQVKCEIVKWPLSVIRLTSANAQQLIDAADHILQAWREYSDPSVGIVAYTAEAGGSVDDANANGSTSAGGSNSTPRDTHTPHNTVTPIARKIGNEYVLHLALRCNITSPERPLGVFHPRPEFHHIKKENIGLIEVMGLAILPARLVNELPDVYSASTQTEVGTVFAQVLEDAGVFKWDESGRAAFNRFIALL